MRLIDEKPRPGAEGGLVAFVHPASAHGVLVELKQAAGASGTSRPGFNTEDTWTQVNKGFNLCGLCVLSVE